MNKQVLFISYFFPPIGGAGVLRVTKFVKYLPTFGWNPYVLTIKKGFYSVRDESLLLDIPSAAHVTRIGYVEPGFWFKNRIWQSFLQYFLYPLLLIPDRQILWFLPALYHAYKIVKKEKITLIFTSSSSYSDHVVALVLKKITGVTWVADFRDEWTQSPHFRFFSPIHRSLAKLLERQILKNANKVIAISKPLTNSYWQTLGSKKDKFITITNGFDKADFENLIYNSGKKKMNLIYAGTVYSSRKSDSFLQALKELNLKNLNVEFIGSSKRLSYRKTLERLTSADVLLLILSPLDSPSVMTSKIFEYLALHKPILAIAPNESGAAKLVQELKVGEIADPMDINEIKEKLLIMYQAWQKNELNIPQVNLEKYERKNLTLNLAEIFNKLNDKKLKLTNKSLKVKLCLVGNASSVHNQNLVNYLKNQDYEIHFLSTTRINIPKVKVYYLGKNYFTPWYFYMSLRKIKHLIKAIQPDIVHGQDLVFAGMWAYLSGFRPYVVTTWGSDVWKFDSFFTLEKYLVRKTLENADLVTGSSLALKKQSKKIGMLEKNWKLVHFGINLTAFKRQKPPVGLRQKVGVQGHQKIIFCPRSIAPIYNTDILIDALALIDGETDAKLFLMETGAKPEYLKKIKKQIKVKNLEENVVFFGTVSQDLMVSLYNLADVIVSLTSSDGCSVSFLEAMACEKKIVATDLPYLEDWAKNHNFWVVPVKDAKKTAQTLVTVLNFPKSKWSKTGRSNRKMIAENAEINSNFEKLDKLYRKLI